MNWLSKQEADLIKSLQQEQLKLWLKYNSAWASKTLENIAKTLEENELKDSGI